MYRVIIVDDEPAAIRHIAMILEKYAHEFQVIGTAENGREAIELIKLNACDLVITDVCMPIMSGLEMIEWIAQERPSLKTIVTSGYQEFEYVQNAINLGASSYLLKPVIPIKMAKMLTKIKEYLEKDYLQQHQKLFNAFYYNEPCDEEVIRKIFTEEMYYIGVKRINGLPTRFSKRNALEIFAEQNKSTIIYGRDLYEELYFIPLNAARKHSIVEFIQDTSNLCTEQGYETLVYFTTPMSVEEFYNKVRELYHSLDSVIVTGENQALTIEEVNEAKISRPSNLTPDELELIFYFIKEKELYSIKKEVSALFDKWKSEKRTQLYMENQAKQILFRVRQSYGNQIPLLETEYLIEEIFIYSNSIDELYINYWEILLKFFKSDNAINKIDTPQFLDMIKEYLCNHIDQQLSLREICNKFGVSQPYLSKMFRKYIDESYNQYVTRLRIEKAKSIMEKNKNMKIKDIAAMVGYNDQFYFSRIFRSFVNITPSEYMNTIN